MKPTDNELVAAAEYDAVRPTPCLVGTGPIGIFDLRKDLPAWCFPNRVQTRSKIVAMPWSTTMHIVANQ